MSGASMIRPWAVVKVQLRLWARGLWAPSIIKMGRTVTYKTVDHIGPIVIRVHYVQIGTEDGEILYKTPHMTNNERKAFIRRVLAIREMGNRPNAQGSYYDF